MSGQVGVIGGLVPVDLISKDSSVPGGRVMHLIGHRRPRAGGRPGGDDAQLQVTAGGPGISMTSQVAADLAALGGGERPTEDQDGDSAGRPDVGTHRERTVEYKPHPT